MNDHVNQRLTTPAVSSCSSLAQDSKLYRTSNTGYYRPISLLVTHASCKLWQDYKIQEHCLAFQRIGVNKCIVLLSRNDPVHASFDG